VTLLGVDDPTLDLATAELCEQIVAIHSALNQLPSLEPGPVVNELFTDLVRLSEYRRGLNSVPVLSDPRVLALTPRLRQLCATGEFRLERAWAHRVLNASDPDAELMAFPYLGNYEELTTLEMHALAGVGLDLAGIRRICFLGGGPLPLSALLMSRNLSATVDVVDVNQEASSLAGQVAERVSLSGQVQFHHADAADFDGVADSDVVVLAALVGLDRTVKHRVLAALSQRMRTGSMLIARSSDGLRTLLYPPLELSDLHDWRPLAVVHPLNGVVNSVVVAVRR
jgi:nicotianamine synthase